MNAGSLEAVRAEWIKVRTIRSTAWALLAFAGVSILFTTLTTSGSSTTGGSPGHPGDNDIILDSLSGIWFGQIGAAVLAVLAITSEYSTRMIRTTLAANPRRRTMLGAKTAVVATVVLVIGFAICVACFLVGQAFLRRGGFVYENGYPAVSLVDGEAFRAVALGTIYLGLMAVFAIGVGAILRHTAGAITLVLAVLLGPVIAFNLLPDRIAEPLEKFSLLGAGLAGQQTVDRADNIPIGPWGGLAVVTAYAAVAFVGALVAISKRDA